jgi:tungstate transport system permease protein
MGYLWTGVKEALGLLCPPSADLLGIIFLSLLVSATATLAAGLLAAPFGTWMAMHEFRFKRHLITLMNTAMAIPAVLIGLLIYMLLSRQGLMGFLGLLFTPWAMILAQAALAFPIVAVLTLSALKNAARDSKDLALSLGASRLQMAILVIRQGRFAFLTALISAFSRLIGETGMTLMVGGNIRGETRVMTTAISLETMKGNFEVGIALGLVLLTVALLVNVLLQRLQGR